MTRRPSRPRRGLQLLIWALVLGVFSGLAVLSGQADTISFGTETSAAAPMPTAPTAPVAPVAQQAGERVLAAPAPGNAGSALPALKSGCAKYDEKRDFLPLNRWTSVPLHTVDNSWLLKTRLFISMIAELLFMIASLAWRIISVLQGAGNSFDMICTAAGPINSVVRTMSLYTSWFLIPAWLFVLVSAIKRWTSSRRGGATAAIRLLMTFSAATGMVFFIGDQSDKHLNDPTAAYTVPWMAATVQGWFGGATDSLYDLGRVGLLQDGKERSPVFYDDRPKGGAGKVTCAALEEALYAKYMADNQNTSLNEGREAMVQLSKMWEVSLLRPWQVAQFGEGSEKYPSPAHASCRYLEASSDVSSDSKMEAFDLSVGNPPGTTNREQMRGWFIDPAYNEQTVMIAWGACKAEPDGRKSTQAIPQWRSADLDSPDKACGLLYGEEAAGNPLTRARINTFYFNGGDELNEKLGDCVATNASCRADWAFVSAWLGANEAQRITQSVMALLVSAAMLFVMGPVALGQTISSVGLAGLVMLLPVTMLLIGMGLPQGKRLLRLTGTSAAGAFLFSMAMTLLTMFINITYQAVETTVREGSAPGFFQQVAQGAAPLVALFLFKKLSRILGLGDISTTSGALGFTGAAMLKATGDRRHARNADRRMASGLRRLGVGRYRLGALDERSLQRRMLVNPATRGAARLAGRGARHVAKPVTDWTRDRYDAARAGLLRGTQALQQKAASGTPAQRAAAYAGLTAAMAGLTTLAPPSILATLPLMAFTGGAAALRGGQTAYPPAADAYRAWRARRRGDGEADGDDSTSLRGQAYHPTAASARTSLRQADDWQRKIIRVGDAEERHRQEALRAESGLHMLRGMQWGPDFDGFHNAEEKAAGLTAMATAMGVKPEQLMAGEHGLVMPIPVMANRRTGRRDFPPGTSLEFAAHPVHYLDPHTLRRQMVDGDEEDDDQYIARLTTQLHERGYMNDDGEFVDAFAANGLDTRVPEVRERVERWTSGAPDEELSRIMVHARRSEDAAVRASRDWSGRERTSHEQRYVQNARVLLETGLPDAREDVETSFFDLDVQLPDGSNQQAGDLQTQLTGFVRAIRQNAADMADLQRQQASMAAADFQRQLNQVTTNHQADFQRFDELAAQVRDAVDQVSSARGICELEKLRIQMDDPRSGVDPSKLRQAAEEVMSRKAEDMGDWHDTVDKLVASLTLLPDTDRDADEFNDALAKFAQTFTKQIRREEQENQDMLDELEEASRTMERNLRMMQSSPRNTAAGPTRSRDFIRTMRQNSP